MILFLSSRIKCYVCWHFRIDLSYYLHWECFLMRAKALHSMRKHLKVLGVWHVIDCGSSSCLSISLIRPMCKWTSITSSTQDFLYPCFHSLSIVLIDNNLFDAQLFQTYCHFCSMNLFVLNQFCHFLLFQYDLGFNTLNPLLTWILNWVYIVAWLLMSCQVCVCFSFLFFFSSNLIMNQKI